MQVSSVHQERIYPLNSLAVDANGEFVLLWLHHAVRVELNPVLDVAIALANELKKPLLVYQGLSGAHRFNSDRSHYFIMAGARDLHTDLAAMGIRYVFNLPTCARSLSPLSALVQRACAFIVEDFPAPPFPRWSKALANRAGVQCFAVDAACIAPLRGAKKVFDRAFDFRAAFQKQWRQIIAGKDTVVHYEGTRFAGELGFVPFDFDRCDSMLSVQRALADCDIDHSIAPILDTEGGGRAGYQRWDHFKATALKQYAYKRNDAADWQAVSRMSAYLHHGHVSALRLAREASAIGGAGAEKFLDELLVWRELSYQWCAHQKNPERLEALPAWAKQTLLLHAKDSREPLCTNEQFARARTELPLWDLAQTSLLRHGELHNNIRMTWAKGIVQHAASPKAALQQLIDLNHRFALDGNNPNSYGGLLWAMGLFDRPFSPEQAVLGTVRGRSIAEHARRIDLAKYANVVRRKNGRALDVCIVGAGMAGASLARALMDAGQKLSVLDKSRSAGGRMSTRRLDASASQSISQYDHGAQYFTARDARFQRWIGLWRDDGIVATWRPRVFEIDTQGARAKASEAVERYVALPGQNALAKHLIQTLPNTLFNATLARIAREDQGFALLDADGKVLHRCRELALCMPAVQAANLLGDYPDALAYANSAAMRPCWALMIEFVHALPTPFDAAFVNIGPIRWIARDSSKPGRPAGERWVVHASAEYSEAMLERSAEEVAKQLLQAFMEIIAAFDQSAREPIYRSAHRWRYALGGRADSNPDAHYFDPKTRLGMAGDWCSSGRVEGAFLSGSALAGSFLSLR
jgi:photolyase PhrII